MSTPNLMRPNNIEEAKGEEARIEGMLSDPKAAIQDRGSLLKQFRAVKTSLDDNVPTPFKSEELDLMAKKAVSLKEKMLSDGMPTQAEMRKAPPGAVGKHMRWERRNKADLIEWKYITQRLNAGSDDPDLVNFERYRPVGGGGEMSMDNALIPGAQYFIPDKVTQATVFSEDDKAALADVDPELADQLALLNNEERAKIKALIIKATAPKAEVTEDDAAKNKAWGEKMTKARATAAAKKKDK